MRGNRKNVIFQAEANSAAAMDKKRLERYSELASTILHTRVLTTGEMLFPSAATFANKITEAMEAFQKLYFISVLHIDYVYVTVILVLINIYNALNDPLMGMIYDKTRTRWGKARPWILFSAAPYFLSTVALYSGSVFFHDTATNDPRKILFVFITLFIQETFNTLYIIPRNNMTSLMTPNIDDRITQGLLEHYIGDFGGMLSYIFFNPLIELNNKGIINLPLSGVFMIFSSVAAVIGVGANIAMVFGCQERILLQPKPAPLLNSMFYIFKNKYALRNFLAEFSVCWWSDGGYKWDQICQHDLFFGGGTIGGFLSETPNNILNTLSITWIPKFRKFFKYNNKRAVIVLRFWDFLCMLGMCTALPFIGEEKKNQMIVTGIYALFLGLNAINNGPSKVFEAELQREITDYTEYLTGERPDGTFYLLANLIKKIASPLNAAFTMFVIQWTGYDISLPMLPWIQNDKRIYQKVFFLRTTANMLPDIIRTIPYFFYDLTGEKREKMYLAINERRALVASDTNSRADGRIETVEHE